MEQKAMLSLIIKSNTTHSNQARKKLDLFKTSYHTIFVYIGMKNRVQNTNFEFSNQNFSKSSCLGDQS